MLPALIQPAQQHRLAVRECPPRPRGVTVSVLALTAMALLAGCQRFHPQPLSPAQTAAQLESRSLTNPALKGFLETNLDHELTQWPVESWDFQMLTLAAFYYQPSLEVARAQWTVARGGETTAAQRPNPTLNVTPGYDATTLVPSPWFPLGFLDVPIETAGKRGYRRAQAAQLSEAARLNLATVAWQVRSNLRTALLDLTAAEQRAGVLQQQVSLQEQIIQALEAQVRAGAIANSEAVLIRIALAKARLDSADAQRARAEARARVAEAIGVPLRALEETKLSFDWLKVAAPVADLTSAEVRRAALPSRPDILGALAEYAASQTALQLEIAKQYPDVHLQPGYQFDQGDSKWSLGLTVELPVLSQNQGPIAEAKARRQEAAARFNALQAKVLADIDRALEVFRSTETNSSGLRALSEAQAARRDSVAAQFKAGATDRADLLNVQLEVATTQLVLLDGQIKLQQALGALEDAVQRPMNLIETVFKSAPAYAR
jgi:outer membrane protein, heavy metal efflux system